MAYSAPAARTFWARRGTITQKLCDELADVETALTALGSGSGALADGKIWVGDGTDTCAAVTMSGDVTIDNTGVTTIGAKKVDPGMVALTEAHILVGDGGAGSDVAISGDIAIDKTGAVTIQAKAVEPSMIALTEAHILVGTGGAGGDVAMSGDATISKTGALTIADNAITSAKTSPEFIQVARADLTAGLENAFAFAWQNPEATAILVHRVLVDVTAVAGTAGALLDVGTAGNATTHSDNLLDGLDIQAATGLFDNIEDKGSNGKTRQRLDAKDGTTDYITGQILAAAGSSLAGKVYIYYTAVPA